MTIGILAPSRPISDDAVVKINALASLHELDLLWHQHCFEEQGHFAGADSQRSDALLEFALRPDLDVIWFARGGYGSMRLRDKMFETLAASDIARNKTYLGYSDTGAILARLYRLGFKAGYHAPMPSDIMRAGGDKAITRVFEWLVSGGAESPPDAAYLPMNLSVLTALCGTVWMPPLAGHILMLEDVGEYHYAIDRMMFTLSQQVDFPKLAGVMCGRFSSIPQNDVDFGETTEEIITRWCAAKHVPYLGTANIGHDVHNAIVRFGDWGSGNAYQDRLNEV